MVVKIITKRTKKGDEVFIRPLCESVDFLTEEIFVFTKKTTAKNQ